MTRAREFRRTGRLALKGKWPVAIMTGLVSLILGGIQSSNFSSENDILQWKESYPGFFNNTVIINIFAIITVLSICHIVLGGVIELGYRMFNLKLIRNDNAKFSDLFMQFYKFGRGFLLRLLTYLFTFLWTLLFIIPGIVAAFAYSMAPYIMADRDDIKAMEAIKLSKKMMKGNKRRLFCLELSFLGWALLCIVTLGFGLLVLIPYMQVSYAAFYEEISKEYYNTKETLIVQSEYYSDSSGI